MAAAQIIETHHKKAVCVDGFARPHHIVPPARIFIAGHMPPRHMVVARQGMANQHRIAFIGIEHAIGFYHQVETRQLLAVLQHQRGVERNFLRGNQPHAVFVGHRYWENIRKAVIIAA